MSLYQDARRYVEQGISVVPLQGKTPMVNWKQYQVERPSLEFLHLWFESGIREYSGVGCICGEVSMGLWVLDFDGPNWEEAFELAKATILDRAGIKTRIVSTGSGRRHIWFRSPTKVASTKIVCRLTDTPLQIDVLGEGSMVVAPPSLHPNGNFYTDNGEDIAEVDNPDDIIEWLRRVWERHPLPKRTRTFLESGAPQGEQNSEAYAAAQQLHHAGFSREEAEDLLRTALERSPQDPTHPWHDDEIERIVRGAYDEKKMDPIDLDEQLAPFNDEGNAQIFVQLHEPTMRYSLLRKSWFVWNGKFWEEDDGSAIKDAVSAVMLFRQEQVPDIFDPDLRKAAAKFCVQCGNAYRYSGLETLATYQAPLRMPDDLLDTSPDLLCVDNGVLDLRDGSLRSHHPGDYMTKFVNIPYDLEATCPRWMQFLEEVFAEHPEIIPFMQRAFGYTLTGHTTEERVFFLTGFGANGKSTLLTVLRQLLGGTMLSRKVDFRIFAPNASDGQRAALALLPGIRLLLATEPPKGMSLDESLLKDISGGEIISARMLYSSRPVEFIPSFKFWVATNVDPVLKERSTAIMRRLTVIPFDTSFFGREDLGLGRQLQQELPGILVWAVRGAQQWYKDGLGSLPTLEKAQHEMFVRTYALDGFIEAECVVGTGLTVTFAEFYQAFAIWCSVNRLQLDSKIAVSRMFHNVPGVQTNIVGGRSYVQGLTLKSLLDK